MTLDEQIKTIRENMRGVILAGGTGTRLMPLTRTINKHLLPVNNKPMIEYPLQTLIDIGIKDILVVTGVDHFGMIAEHLRSGKDYDAEFTYKVQDKAGGIAEALSLAEDFSQEKKLAVILGDNIFGTNFKPEAIDFIQKNYGAMFFLKEVDDPERFGVATIDEANKKIVKIVEKPAQPESKLAVTGLYFYDNTVFDRIRPLQPSKRGELEISHVNESYVKEGNIHHHILLNWFEAGTHEGRENAEEHLRRYNNARKK